jgi:hypothetical protein
MPFQRPYQPQHPITTKQFTNHWSWIEMNTSPMTFYLMKSSWESLLLIWLNNCSFIFELHLSSFGLHYNLITIDTTILVQAKCHIYSSLFLHISGNKNHFAYWCIIGWHRCSTPLLIMTIFHCVPYLTFTNNNNTLDKTICTSKARWQTYNQ